jgi:fructose-1,6-bisphosphatase/inositol monophosphatase family enzyme
LTATTDLRLLRAQCIDLVVAGATAVQPYQLPSGREDLHARVKPDRTFVSEADLASQDQIRPLWLQNRAGGVLLLEEELRAGGLDRLLGELAPGTAPRLWLGDPLDGTIGVVAGTFTSTVGVGALDLETGRLLAAAIASPISGAVWSTSLGEPVLWWEYDPTDWTPQEGGEVPSLADRPPRERPLILLDHADGFTRKDVRTYEDREVISQEQALGVLVNLARAGNLKMFGSNLGHQRMVAEGGADFSATLATGGPWDLLGLLLVLASGGAVRLFRSEEYRPGEFRLHEVPPLHILEGDVAFTAVSEKLLNDTLERWVFPVLPLAA